MAADPAKIEALLKKQESERNRTAAARDGGAEGGHRQAGTQGK